MKVINISDNLIFIVYLKDKEGNDRIVKMHPQDHVFSPTNEKTKSVTLQGIKKNLAVVFDSQKPEHLEYFIPYKEEQLTVLEVSEISIKIPELNLGSQLSNPIEEISNEIIENNEIISNIKAVHEYYKDLNITDLVENKKDNIEDIKSQAISLFHKGLTVAKIAKKTGASRSFISNLLNDYNKESGKKLKIK